MTTLGYGLVLLAALASCNGNTPVQPEAGAPKPAQESEADGAGAELELRFDETADHAVLEIEWVDLEDSRCPTGVQCIWAGQLVTTLEVRRGTDEPERIELLRRVGDDPEAVTALGFEFRLLDVQPHPKDGVTIERDDYVATIEVAQP